MLINTDTSSSDRGGPEDILFSGLEGSNGRVFACWRGRQVAILKGAKAVSFLQRVSGLNIAGQQKAMAKVTGKLNGVTSARQEKGC
jgi:hypothetical protein